MISKTYLSPFGITRAEQRLYVTSASMRSIFGRTSMNSPSRFIREISEELIESPADNNAMQLPFGKSSMESKTRFTQGNVQKRPAVTKPAATGGESLGWKVGDKAEHKKWGVGMVVSVRGAGDDLELDIAFPSEGIKRLLAKFAPITKV